MNTRTGRSIIPMLAITLALVAALLLPLASAGNVQSVNHSPTTVTDSDEVVVTLVLKNSDNVSEVDLKYCEDDVCYTYEDMDQDGQDTYTYTIPAIEGGTRVGYNISIEYDDGRDNEYPAPSSGYFYYTVEGEEDDEDSPFPGTSMMLAGFALSLVLFRRRRKM